MKRLLMIIFIWSLALFINGCEKEVPVTASDSSRNSYTIKVEYDAQNRTLKGNENLLYINKDKTQELYFHLYPNAYKEEGTSPEFNSILNSYPSGFNEGYIDIIQVKINGNKVEYSIDGQLLKLGLPAELVQEEVLKVELSFQAKLPDAKTRYGQYEGLTHCAYWYPLLAVYDERGWDTASFYPIGESSYSETADYLVSITLPREETVAATGQLVSEKKQGLGKKTLTYKETEIRDFAWFSAKDFKVTEIEAGGIIYKYYYQDEKEGDSAAVLEQCVAVFDFYNKQFGRYPYKQFSIVKTQVATCEFPEIITLTDSNLKDFNMLRLSVAHEAAHQWWYLAVGNNPRQEPWLDEALASYSTHLYNESLFGDIATRIDILERIPANSYDLPIEASVEQFKSMSDYGEVVYNLGSIALNDLRQKIGRDTFDKVLSSYYQENLLKNAETDDFLKILEELCGKDAADWFQGMLAAKGHPFMTQQEKLKAQSSIVDEERNKLKSGEMYAYVTMKYGEKILCQPIELYSCQDVRAYEGLMPILQLNAIQGEALKLINVVPDDQVLEGWAREGYGKKSYDIQRPEELGACAYLYGEPQGVNYAITVMAFPSNSENVLSKSYENILSTGNRSEDGRNIYFYKDEKVAAAAYELDYKGNPFRVIIINSGRHTTEIEPVAKQVYENLKE